MIWGRCDASDRVVLWIENWPKPWDVRVLWHVNKEVKDGSMAQHPVQDLSGTVARSVCGAWGATNFFYKKEGAPLVWLNPRCTKWGAKEMGRVGIHHPPISLLFLAPYHRPIEKAEIMKRYLRARWQVFCWIERGGNIRHTVDAWDDVGQLQNADVFDLEIFW